MYRTIKSSIALAVLFLAGLVSAQSQLVFTQYIEDASGGNFYKGVEIVNTSAQDIDFSQTGLVVGRGGNGSLVLNPSININNGVLVGNGVLVIGTQDLIDALPGNFAGISSVNDLQHNGDDAIVMEYAGNTIDMIGLLGQRPNGSWSANGVSTKDANIGIKVAINTGDDDGWTDPSERFEYIADGNDPQGFGVSPYAPPNNNDPKAVFISQYVETNSGTTPKAIEIVNNTGSTIDFVNKELVVLRGSNGNPAQPDIAINSGTLADKAVMVIGSQDVIDYVNQNTPGVRTELFSFFYNGDDALALELDGTIVDMFGLVGNDPGSAWTGNGVSTANSNIKIKTGIEKGDPDGWTDPSDRFETVVVDLFNDFGISPFPLNNGGGSGQQSLFADLPFIEDFEMQTDLAPFVSVDVKGIDVWELGEFGGDSYAEGNAFGATGADNGEEGWLITPAFDFRRYDNIELVFDYTKRFNDNNIQEEIQLLYSVEYSGTGNPNDVTWNVINTDIDYNRSSNQRIPITPIDLDFIQARNVRLALKYTASGNGNGSTSVIRVDEFNLTGDPIIAGMPSDLAIAEAIPASPIQNLNFQIVVEAVDATGTPQVVSQDTDININLVSGNGNLGGSMTGTITAGSYYGFAVAKYDQVGMFEIEAEDVGANLATSNAFLLSATPGPSFLRIDDFSSKGYLEVPHPAFSVSAVNADNSVNTQFNAFEAQFVVYDAGSNPVDTFNAIFSNGYADFTNVVFNTTGIFTVGVTSEGLSEDVRLSLTVNDIPSLYEQIIPKYFMGYFDGSQVYNEQIPNWALVTIDNLHPDTEYNYTAAMVAEDFYVNNNLTLLQNARSRGININHDDRTGEYWVNDFGQFNRNASCPKEKRFSTFVTGSGETSKNVWIPMLMNGDGMFESGLNSTVGDSVWWTVTLGDEDLNKLRVIQAKTASEIIKFNSNPNDRQYSATGLWDDATDLAPNTYLALYEDTRDTRPYTITKIMSGNLAIQTVTGYDAITCEPNEGFDPGSPQYYTDLSGYYEQVAGGRDYSGYVMGTPGAWATFIPNDSRLEKITHIQRDGSINEIYESQTAKWDGKSFDMTTYTNLGLGNSLNFEVPQLELRSFVGLNGQNFCNDQGFLEIDILARGIGKVNVIVEESNGNREVIARNVDVNSNSVNDITTVIYSTAPQTYTDDLIRIIVEDSDNPFPTYIDVSDLFILYDAPRILDQSQSGTYCATEDIILSNISNGSDLTYQWFKDGEIIPGATTAGFLIENAKHTDSGVYTFTVSGKSECPSINSENIVINVARNTEITEEPLEIDGVIGGMAQFEFSAHVNGLPPNYRSEIQWYKDDVALVNNERISGSNSNILHINGLVAEDFIYTEGYYARIVGRCDTAWTKKVAVKESAIIINSFTVADKECETGNAQFSIDAASTNNETLTFKWMKDGSVLADNARIIGSSTNVLSITNLELSDAGSYSVEIESADSDLKVSSSAEDFSVSLAPSITKDLAPALALAANDPLNIFVEVTGTKERTFQWYKDGNEIVGATNDTLALAAVATTDAGEYYVVVSNDCGDATSLSVNVTVTGGIVAKVETELDQLTIGYPVPNPSDGQFTISLDLGTSDDVNIQLISPTGRVLFDESKGTHSAGKSVLTINLTELNLAVGQYYLQVTVGSKSILRTLNIVK